MHTYEAYGLVAESAFRLPGLDRASADAGSDDQDADPDVRIRAGATPDPDEPIEDGLLYRHSGGHYMRVPGVGDLFATDGTDLVIDADEGVESDRIAQFVLGAGFRVLLHQRGYVVFHASAAVVEGRAVAFVGQSGQGKSTTAAGFHDAGYPVVADDVTAVDADALAVRPGVPHVKLDRNSASAVGGDLSPAQSGDLEREYYDASAQGESGAVASETAESGATASDSDLVPLGAFYLLEDGPAVGVESVPPGERPYHLMRTSASAYRTADDAAVRSHFEECVRLGANVPMKRLRRPREYDALPEMVRAVEADLADKSPTET